MTEDDLPVTSAIVVPARDLSWKAVRASGPGGQNVNKVASKVELRFDLVGTTALDAWTKDRLARLARLDADGRIVIVSQLTRDQPKNLEDARAKLAELIRRALERPKPRRATKPTRGAKERRLASKKKDSEKKRLRRGDD